MTIDAGIDVDVRDDEVGFTLTVTNAGQDQVDLQFSDAQTVDFAVLQDGTEVWRFAEGQMFAQMLQTKSVDAGDSLTFEGVWPDPAPGDYEVVGTLEASNADAEARRDFSV